MADYYDKAGQPISAARWCELFEDMGYRRIALTELPDGRQVSTVWLGANHQFGDGPPLIFETMVRPSDEICQRYSTLEAARTGHAALCERLAAEEPSGQGGQP